MADQNPHELQPRATVVTDVDIPFGRWIVILLKLMLASIPAVILFYLVMLLFVLAVTALTGGAFSLFQGGFGQ